MHNDVQSRWRRGLSLGVDLASVALLVVAGVLLIASRGRSDGAPAAGPVVGAPVPAIEVIDAVGRQTWVFGERGAGPALVLVFRTDCPVCGRERPTWIRLAGHAAAEGLSVLALTPEPLDSTVAAYFAEAPEVEVRQVADPGSLASALGIRAVPTTFVVEAGGRLGFAYTGLLPPDRVTALRAAVEAQGRGRG